MSDLTQEERNAIARKRMLDLQRIRVVPMPPDSPYITPLRLNYIQDGREKSWDIIRTHGGVYIIIFNLSRKKLIFVRQFRPALYFSATPGKLEEIDVKKYSPTLGLALELCAGMVDKNKSLVEIAREEVIEECGYEAPVSTFEKVNSFRSGVGDTAATQTLFYVEVTDEMQTHPGGGAESEGELIEVIEMSVEEVKEYINSGDVQSATSFLYGVTWFLANKQDRYR